MLRYHIWTVFWYPTLVMSPWAEDDVTLCVLLFKHLLSLFTLPAVSAFSAREVMIVHVSVPHWLAHRHCYWLHMWKRSIHRPAPLALSALFLLYLLLLSLFAPLVRRRHVESHERQSKCSRSRTSHLLCNDFIQTQVIPPTHWMFQLFNCLLCRISAIVMKKGLYNLKVKLWF